MSKDKESIQVTIRVRPLSEKQKQQDNRVCVNVEQETHSLQTAFGNETKKFTFDSICNNNSQEDMFEKVGKRSTVYCLQGYNCTIFAYGQTGSGKTFTMMGVDPAHEQYYELRGLIPRTLEYLFQSIDQEIKQTGAEYIIRCSFLEIYNQQIIDLLNKNNSNLQIREDIRKGVYVEGISEEAIFRGQEALQILKKGSKGRHVGSTCYNETSSRSHSVFTMQIESKHIKAGVVNTKIRYFHFIDLAGSERTKLINGDRLKQGCSINKSLHVLGKVINSLAESSQNKPRHVNYRDSKLTFLLKDSLGGNSKTHLIANISPCTMSYSETNMTLSFARRVKLIKVNKASINEDTSGNLQSLKSQIKRLKQEILALKNGSVMVTAQSMNSFEGQLLNATNRVLGKEEICENGNQATKIYNLLNQYIGEEIDKQTQLTQEISKLNRKIECMEGGILKFSENQIHLKTIIKIYEDKLRRMQEKVKNYEQQAHDVLAKDGNETIMNYFEKERTELNQQLISYKNILNAHSLMNLLRNCKVYQIQTQKATPGLQNLLKTLEGNSHLLSELLQNVVAFSRSRDGPSLELQEKMVEIQLEYNKRESEYIEKVEQLADENNQLRQVNEQNQNLLKESVNRQISLEEELKLKSVQIQTQHNKLQQISVENSNLAEKNRKLEQEKQTTVRQCQQFKVQIQTLKAKISEFQLRQNKAEEQKQVLVEKLRQSQKAQFNLQEQISQMQNKQENFEKLVQQLKQAEKEVEQAKKVLEGSKKQSKEQIYALKTQILEKDTLTENLKQKVEQIDTSYKKLLQQNEQMAQSIDMLEKSLRQQKEKTHKLVEQKESGIQLLQELRLLEKKNYYQLEEKNTKINHLNALLKDKERVEEELIQKHKAKEEEIMRMMAEWETNDNEAHEEIHKVKLQLLNQRQAKEELITQVNKLTDVDKQKQIVLTQLEQSLQENQRRLVESEGKNTQLKEEIQRKREEIRQLELEVEDYRLQKNQNFQKLSSAKEELIELVQKNSKLSQTLKEQKAQVHILKVSLKEMQGKIFCMQQNFHTEKESLLREAKESKQQIEKLLEGKEQQVRKLNKVITNLKESECCLQGQIEHLHRLNEANEKTLKGALQAELQNKEQKIRELVLQNRQLKEEKQILMEEKKSLDVSYKEESERVSEKHLKAIQSMRSQFEIQLMGREEENTRVIIVYQKEVKLLKEQFQVERLKELQEMQVEHNGHLDAKNQQIESLREQLQILRQKVDEKENQVQQFYNQLQESKRQIQFKKRQVQEKDNQIEKNSKLIEEKNNQIEEKNNQIEEKRKQAEEAKAQVEKRKKQLEEKSQQIESIKQQIVSRTLQLHNVQQQVHRLNTQLNNMSYNLLQQSQAVQKVAELENQLKNLKEDKEIQIHSLQEMHQKQLHLVRANICQSETASASLKELINSLELKLSHSEQKKRQVQRQLQKLQQLQEQTQKYQKQHEEQIAQLKQQLSQTQNDLNQSHNQLQTLSQTQAIHKGETQARLGQLTRNLQLANSQINQKQVQLSALSEQLQHQKQLVEELQNKLEQKKQNYLQLKALLQEKQQELQQHKEMNLREKQLQDLQNQQREQEIESKVKALSETLQQARQKNHQLQQKLRNQQTNLLEITQNLNHIQIKLQKQMEQNAKIKAQQAQMTQQSISLKKQNKQLVGQTQKLNEKIQSLEEELELATNTIKTQKGKLEEQQYRVKELQNKLSHLIPVQHQKEQLMESYKSLQAINKGLGQKCQELLSSLEEQKTEYRKLETKYLGEKNINGNLKQLIENSEAQKRQLSKELDQKTMAYEQLIQKLGKNTQLHQKAHQKSSKSEHYVKTVQLLQKSRQEQLQLKKQNEELKKYVEQLKRTVKEKEVEIQKLASKSEEYSKTIHNKVRQFEEDYIELEGKYEQLLKEKEKYQDSEKQNKRLIKQLEETRPKISRMTLRIQELQQKIRGLNQAYVEIEGQNYELKKRILYPGGSPEEKTAHYINKLKADMNELKRQKSLLEDSLKKESGSKVAELKYELEKKQSEVKYLQEIIAEQVELLKIKQFEQGNNPNSIKIQSLRKSIFNAIRETLQENQILRQKLSQTEKKTSSSKEKGKENKYISSIIYSGCGSSGKKESKEKKSYSMKLEEKEQELSNLIRNKIAQNSHLSSSCVQKRREKKGGLGVNGILQKMKQSVNRGPEQEEQKALKMRELVSNIAEYKGKEKRLKE